MHAASVVAAQETRHIDTGARGARRCRWRKAGSEGEAEGIIRDALVDDGELVSEESAADGAAESVSVEVDGIRDGDFEDEVGGERVFCRTLACLGALTAGSDGRGGDLTGNEGRIMLDKGRREAKDDKKVNADDESDNIDEGETRHRFFFPVFSYCCFLSVVQNQKHFILSNKNDG